jgi:hypothetical protein
MDSSWWDTKNLEVFCSQTVPASLTLPVAAILRGRGRGDWGLNSGLHAAPVVNIVDIPEEQSMKGSPCDLDIPKHRDKGIWGG